MSTLFPGSLSFSPAVYHRPTIRVSRIVRTAASGGDTMDWVAATSTFFDKDSRPIMLFDGVCNMCNGGVRFVRDNDRNRTIRYEALQSEAGKKLLRRSGRAPDDISSVVLVEKDRSYIKSDAVLKIMEYLDLPFPQLALFLQFVPLFVRDLVYDNIANNRYTVFGKSDSCEIYLDQKLMRSLGKLGGFMGKTRETFPDKGQEWESLKVGRERCGYIKVVVMDVLG